MSVKIEQFGELGILLSWPQTSSEEISREIYFFNIKIKQDLCEWVTETVMTYTSLMLYLKKGSKPEPVLNKLQLLLSERPDLISVESQNWRIPVCYDEKFAIDLRNLAKNKKLTQQQVINLHCAATYTVNFIGFLPGFPYLSGLNPVLHTPRLSSPRTKVAKGSVAIGGGQTGVYPMDSPGGWHIIGRTPQEFFNVNNNPPVFLRPLDTIEFYPISLSEYENVC